MLTKEEFEARYGSEVARGVQFVDGVDCFYDNSQIEEFLEHAYRIYCCLEHVENDAKLKEIFSNKEKISNLKSALKEIANRDRSNDNF